MTEAIKNCGSTLFYTRPLKHGFACNGATDSEYLFFPPNNSGVHFGRPPIRSFQLMLRSLKRRLIAYFSPSKFLSITNIIYKFYYFATVILF